MARPFDPARGTVGRREFINLLGGAVTTSLAWPLAASAERSKMLRVGMVSPDPRTSPFTSAFYARMRELGYVEGQNFVFEFIDLHGEVERGSWLAAR